MLIFLQDISTDTIVQITSLFVATATFIIAQYIERKRDRKIARRDVYQKLELASVELFRFEADHLELIRPVWEAGHPLPKIGTAEYTATSNYICQILNLFELAIKFRKDNTMPPDIFGSWVAWFYQLLKAPGFPEIWSESRFNYLPLLREIMEDGLSIRDIEPDPEVQESRFYEYISHRFKCDIIQSWKKKTENNPLDDFWKSGLRSKKTSSMTDAKHITIQWLANPASAKTLAKLFMANSGKQYISHGEIQEGRALNQKDWAPDLEEHLTGEFEEALYHAPFQHSNIIAATQHDAIIGFIMLEYDQSAGGTYATMSDIIVDKNYRNIKIGEKLITWTSEQLKANQITRIYAESNISNEIAHDFLAKVGFKSISKVFLKEMV